VITTEHTNMLIRHFCQIGAKQVFAHPARLEELDSVQLSLTLTCFPPCELTGCWWLLDGAGGGSESRQAAGAGASKESSSQRHDTGTTTTCEVRATLNRRPPGPPMKSLTHPYEHSLRSSLCLHLAGTSPGLGEGRGALAAFGTA
jgi:hypothetical protein